MIGYDVLTLDALMSEIGEEKTLSILADYSCPLNADIEHFLLHSAIPFSRQGIAKTHLVFASYRGEAVLVGYFALAYKTCCIRHFRSFNAKMRTRIKRFATFYPESGSYEISVPLIAQLGKNFSHDYNKLITGDELLSIACEKVMHIQSLMGGKFAYLECDDKPRLIAFYERNGFIPFDTRPLDKLDRETFKSDHLVQLIKYF